MRGLRGSGITRRDQTLRPDGRAARRPGTAISSTLQVVGLADALRTAEGSTTASAIAVGGSFGHAEGGDQALGEQAPGLGVGELGEALDADGGGRVRQQNSSYDMYNTLRYGGRRDRPVGAPSAATREVSQTEVARVERPCASSSRVPSWTRRCQRRQRNH